MTAVWVGTSGWSYPSWRPGFYPADARPDELLGRYAAALPAVELNATKYRLPSPEQFGRWATQVPEGFRFAVKAPDRIETRLEGLQAGVLSLGNRLGCVRLVVERPRDEGLVELILRSTDERVRWAFDLRDPSWDGIEPRLTESGAVRVGDESGNAGWCYLRFRELAWDSAALDAIGARLAALREREVETFAFFRHGDEPDAPLAARAVLERLGDG